MQKDFPIRYGLSDWEILCAYTYVNKVISQETEEFQQEYLKIRDTLFDGDDYEAMSWKNSLGSLLGCQGRHEESVVLHEAVYAMLPKNNLSRGEG